MPIPASRDDETGVTFSKETPAILTIPKNLFSQTKDILSSAPLANQQKGAAVTPDAACFVGDMEELAEALADDSECTVITLVSTSSGGGVSGDGNSIPSAAAQTPFVFRDEILVSKRVIIQGNSVLLPFLDCSQSIRCFRVMDGGYLELRYVRINQSDKGVLRPVNPLYEGFTVTGMVREYRGSSVYFEPGATGGRFLGVYFDDDQSDETDWIVEQSFALTSFRIYGGFVFMAGGRLQFELCLFYDFEFVTPLDRIYLGGDVLVLAGEVSFTGCVWAYITFLGFENGAGFNVAMLGGVAIYTFCQVRSVALGATFGEVLSFVVFLWPVCVSP